MKKAEKFLLLFEKYKHIDFKKIDRNHFEKIRKEEIENFDKINLEAITKAVNNLAVSSGKSIGDLKKMFKQAFDKKSYASLLLVSSNFKDRNIFKEKDIEAIAIVSKEFGKKIDKLNLDLIADDKTLEKEGFFREYPHLKNMTKSEKLFSFLEVKIELYADGKYLSTTTKYTTVKDAINSLKGKDYIDVAGKGKINIKGKKITGLIIKR